MQINPGEREVCDWCRAPKPRASELELTLKGWLVSPKRLVCPAHIRGQPAPHCLPKGWKDAL